MNAFRKRLVMLVLLNYVSFCYSMQISLGTELQLLLSSPHTKAESFAPLLLQAQNQRNNTVMQAILDHMQRDTKKLNELISATQNTYDNNGDNLAITIAKKLDEPSPKMMDFYGNWKEQQSLATLTPEKAESMNEDDL